MVPYRFIFVLIVFFILCDSICQKPRVRQAWSDLTLQEQHRYIRAITLAYNAGRFEAMSEVHIDTPCFVYAHHNSGFFLWHRWFIYNMENYLRGLGPEFECLTLPFWDWEYHNGDMTSATHVLNSYYYGTVGTEETAGCVTNGFFVNWTPGGNCVTRTWDGNFTVVSQKLIADMYADFPFFGIDAHGFRSNFEAAPHSNVHNWIGGNMGSSYSTYDPIFYLHHSNVDRLFSMWQDCHDYDKVPVEKLGFDNYVGTTAGYNGIDEVIPYGSPLFPEPVTPRTIYHINGNRMTKMHYTYSRHRFPALISQNRKGCNWDWFPVAKPSVPVVSSSKIDEIRKAQQIQRELLAEDNSKCSKVSRTFSAIEVIEENESDGKLHLTKDLHLGYSNNYNDEQVIGIRFLLDIPTDVNITDARLHCISSERQTDKVYLKIQAEKRAFSRSFSTKAYVSPRKVFSERVPWNINVEWWKDQQVSSPNINILIQNIIQQSDWEPKNPIALIIRSIQPQDEDRRKVKSDLSSISISIDYCT